MKIVGTFPRMAFHAQSTSARTTCAFQMMLKTACARMTASAAHLNTAMQKSEPRDTTPLPDASPSLNPTSVPGTGACTVEKCGPGSPDADPETGCFGVPDDNLCEDGKTCTSEGQCVAADPVDCTCLDNSPTPAAMTSSPCQVVFDDCGDGEIQADYGGSVNLQPSSVLTGELMCAQTTVDNQTYYTAYCVVSDVPLNGDGITTAR